jgi:hypothetical protein
MSRKVDKKKRKHNFVFLYALLSGIKFRREKINCGRRGCELNNGRFHFRFSAILLFVNPIIPKNLIVIQFNASYHLIYLINKFLPIFIFG